MKTKGWAIFAIILCTVCTSAAAFFNKRGASVLEMTIRGTLLNYQLIIGLFLLGVASILLMISLKGGEVSVIYPIIATSYIWVIILAYYILGEPINSLKIFGIIFIIMGVLLLTTGNNIIEKIKKNSTRITGEV